MKVLKTRTNLNALNDQQRKAVLSKSKRILVLAGAGSGKTNTLLQKINYLINDEQVDSKHILAITFTKNAANEMIDRMILSVDETGYYRQVMETKGISQKELGLERGRMLKKYTWLNQITFKTFHSLCYQILRDDGVNVFDNQFKIVPEENNSDEFSRNTASETESEIVQKQAIILTKDKDYLIKLKRYILDYLVDNIREDERNLEFRLEGKYFTTLKGDHVRSKSEQYIADWLFRHNIEYKYEPAERVDKKTFHPDFFISSANIYLEHVSDLSYPTFWKEMELKKGGATCIKTFDKATHNSAVFNDMLDKVIKGRISKDFSATTVLNYHEEFASFKKECKKFYRLVRDVKGTIKTSGKSIEAVKEEASKSEHERVRLFYEVALPIIEAYDDYCKDHSYLDFDGMIDYSIKLFKEFPQIRSRYQQKFKYVMVDEFQDVNNQQVELLKYLVNKDSQLFCVGDDWQSIYGFRGSEIDYIVNFKKHFEKPELITLNLNYRSTDHIVKASNEVIKKNKFQVPKDIKAVTKGGPKIEVNHAEVEGETESFIWKKIQHHIQEGISPDEILILYRRSAMSNEVRDTLKKSGVRVQLKTIHGSKGLEAKVVFILGLHAGTGGFPDPWMQDKIYHVIKKTDRDVLMEEERRLFYVALTRAKKHLYLMSQKGSVSDFVKEIPTEYLLINSQENTAIDQRLMLCSKCECKLEEHFKFCPECGCSIYNVAEECNNNDKSFEAFKKEIDALPLKHNGYLEEHIYRIRFKYRRAYEPWSKKEVELFKNCANQYTIKDLSEIFGRSEGGIKAKLNELNIE